MMEGLGNYFGLGLEIVSPGKCEKIHPLLDVKGSEIVGGLYSKTDGGVDPTGDI
jgi:hypothetical protein